MSRSGLALILIACCLVSAPFRTSSSASGDDASPILFLHGIASSDLTWDAVVHRLTRGTLIEPATKTFGGTLGARSPLSPKPKKGDIYTLNFSDNQNLTFDAQGVEVAAAVDEIRTLTGSDKVILVGHSMGGLAARAYVQNHGADRVAGLVTIGTPHAGLLLAYIDEAITEYEKSEPAKANLLRLYLTRIQNIQPNSIAARALRPESDDMRRMYEQVFPPQVPIVNIVSDWTPADPAERSQKELLGEISATIWQKHFVSTRTESLLDAYTPAVQRKFNDGLVPLPSQDMRIGVANGRDLDIRHITVNAFYTDEPGEVDAILEAIEQIRAARPTPSPAVGADVPDQSAVLCLDVSGSMAGEKLSLAVRSACEYIEMAAVDNLRAQGGRGAIGLVAFSSDARVVSPLRTDFTAMPESLETLRADGNTNIGAGLAQSINLLTSTPGLKSVILLSDGITNEGLTPDQIVAGPLRDAVQQAARIFTIGLGPSKELNEELLMTIARATGGAYLHLTDPAQLPQMFRKAKHQSAGVILAESGGSISEGERKFLPVFVVSPGQPAFQFSLGWPGSRLGLELADPAGVSVTDRYPGATVRRTKTLIYGVVDHPKSGRWKPVVIGEDVPAPAEPFSFIVSAAKPAANPPASAESWAAEYESALRSGNVSKILPLFSQDFKDDAGVTFADLYGLYVKNHALHRNAQVRVIGSEVKADHAVLNLEIANPPRPTYTVTYMLKRGKPGWRAYRAQLGTVSVPGKRR